MEHLIPDKILTLVERLKQSGGKSYLVGGGVIDLMQGKKIKDWDIEVFGLNYFDIEMCVKFLKGAKADLIGQKFGVVKVSYEGLDIELSIPRRDSKVGPKHQDFDVELIPDLTIREAARRRDFTINALYYDFETKQIIDPFNGLEDLANGYVHYVDRDTFTDDPLRAFRAMQIVARKGKHWSKDLRNLIVAMAPVLKHLSGESIFGEMNKLLMLADKPSIGFIEASTHVGIFSLWPELKALWNCKQNPEWHPEGNAWTHTLMVVDEAAKYRDELPEEWRLPFMWGMLLHDIGKPIASHWNEEKQKITSIDHDEIGEPIARQFMERLTNNQDLIDKVCAIVKVHMRPRLLLKATPKRAAWRRLQNVCPLDILAYVSMVDNDGRGETQEKLGKSEPSFIKTMEVHRELGSPSSKIKPILMGRHLIERGHKPSPKFGPILERAYEYQLETGCEDIEELYNEANQESSS